MKAPEVLLRYAAGERNFQGANLRGANFKGQDLSGADFSNADIRSANFSNATLKSVNFTRAQAGLQKRWAAAQLILILMIAGIAGILQTFAGAFAAFFLESSNFSSSLQQVVSVAGYLLLIAVTYIAIWLQGFSIRAFGSIMTAFAFAVAGAVMFAFVFAVAGAFAFAVAVAGAGTVAFSFAVAFAVVVAVVFAGTFAVAVAVAFTVAVAFAGLLFSLFVGWRALQEDKNFDIIRTIGLALSVVGGTSFHGANLTGTTFRYARLKSTNFASSQTRKTNLTHVCWQGAKQLNRARLGTTVLQDRCIRTLLDGSKSGYKQDLSNANLRGANLSGLTLESVILTRSILSNARLHKTILEGANLTGAILEGWNIDSTTVLKNIDCRYVFLLEKPNKNGDQERRPHDPNKTFQPGDFEKFFKEMLDEVQILIRDGIHPTAFRAAFQSIMQQNPNITPDAITGYEKHGSDVMLTLQVPEGTNKADLEHAWEEGYQTGLKAGRDAEKLESIDFLKQTLLLSAGKNNTFVNENKLMTGNDQSQNIDVTGDFTVTANQSVVSLRAISGQVNNQITQLSDEPTQTQLKDLLTQLQTAIEAEPAFTEEQKTEALEEVKELAAAGQAPQDGPMRKAAKRAITVLKGMTVGLGETTKFVEACNGLLPAISALFAL